MECGRGGVAGECREGKGRLGKGEVGVRSEEKGFADNGYAILRSARQG